MIQQAEVDAAALIARLENVPFSRWHTKARVIVGSATFFDAFSALSLAFALPVLADINIGVTLSATGPAASLGIPEKNTIEMLPTTMAGQKVNWIILDDGSDTTKAVTNTKKLIAEDKVDVIVGSTVTPCRVR